MLVSSYYCIVELKVQITDGSNVQQLQKTQKFPQKQAQNSKISRLKELILALAPKSLPNFHHDSTGWMRKSAQNGGPWKIAGLFDRI